MKTITKIVRVQIQKEYEIELPAENLNVEDWSKDLWPIDHENEIFKFAAEMAAQGLVERDIDGIGRFTEHFPGRARRSDATFLETFSDIESEILQ